MSSGKIFETTVKGIECTVTYVGNVVNVRVYAYAPGSFSQGDGKSQCFFGTLPEGFRPYYNVSRTIESHTGTKMTFIINTAGEIYIGWFYSAYSSGHITDNICYGCLL